MPVSYTHLDVYKRQVTETAVDGNVIILSTPIAAQMQLSETAVDSGIQLTQF